MSNTKTIETSHDTVSDIDIEALLHEAYLGSIRQTDEYLFGRLEERLEAERESFTKSFKKIVGVADVFFSLIKKKFPEIKIKQFRIGIDYSSRVPAAIMLIDNGNSEDVFKVRNLARSFEKFAWSHNITECYLWTKVDKNIEQELLETDFPFYRKSL